MKTIGARMDSHLLDLLLLKDPLCKIQKVASFRDTICLYKNVLQLNHYLSTIQNKKILGLIQSYHTILE